MVAILLGKINLLHNYIANNFFIIKAVLRKREVQRQIAQRRKIKTITMGKW